MLHAIEVQILAELGSSDRSRLTAKKFTYLDQVPTRYYATLAIAHEENRPQNWPLSHSLMSIIIYLRFSKRHSAALHNAHWLRIKRNRSVCQLVALERTCNPQCLLPSYRAASAPVGVWPAILGNDEYPRVALIHTSPAFAQECEVLRQIAHNGSRVALRPIPFLFQYTTAHSVWLSGFSFIGKDLPYIELNSLILSRTAR